MKLRIKILVGFMSVIALMGILGAVTYSNFLEINEQFEFLIEHDLQVLQNAEHLQKDIVDAETGQRGFLITGEEEFLEPYYSGISDFNRLIEIEKELVSDNPPQVQRLERIEILFAEWNEKSARPEINMARIAHETDINSKTLEAVLAKGIGKGILDELRVLLDESIQREAEEEEFDQQLLLIQIGKDLVDRETGQRGFLITGEEEFLEPYYLGNKNLELRLNELLISIEEEEEEEAGHIAGDEHEEDETESVHKIIELAKRWDVEAAIHEINARKLINENPTIYDVSFLLRDGTGKNILDNIREEFEVFIQIENDLKDTRFDKVQGIKTESEINIVIFITIAAAIGIGIAISLSHSINKSLNLLIVGAKRFGKGDFETIPISGDDEISDLSNSFNEMAL